jgi:signal transducing adaptor molecule
MNESFVKARTIFDRMMEESLARHSECNGPYSRLLSQLAKIGTLAVYEQQRPTPFPQPQSTYPRAGQQPPGYGRPADQPQTYAWNTSGYDQAGYGMYPNAPAAYTQPRQGGPTADPRANLGRSASYAAGQPQTQAQPPSQQAQQAPQPHPQTAYVQPYPAQDNSRAPYYPQQAEGQPQPEQAQSPGQPPQAQQPPQVQLQSHPQSQPTQQQPQVSIQMQPQAQAQSVMQQQHQAPAQTGQSPVEAHAQPEPQKRQSLAGPPFMYDPTATYPDQNVQAWAQYYAQGGTDPTGSVYFISVPGVTDARSPPTAAPQQGAEGQQQQQQQQQAMPFSGTPSSALPVHIVTQGLQRQNSLPNPYGPGSTTSETVGPASNPPGGPDMGGRPPWETAAATTMPGQFAQMRVGEPSVGA